MSSAAGAPPPPPPPPPPPGRSFDTLPAELLLSIIQYMQTNDYVAFALAVYPILQRHGLVPPLTVDIYHRITRQGPLPSDKAHSYWPLPVELTEEVLHYLEPADRIAFLFSHRDLFSRYLPLLSEDTKKRLWSSREKKSSSPEGDDNTEKNTK